MGFLGKVFKGVGKLVGKVAKGVVKFAKSPLGKMLINVGLSFVTGGAGGLIAKAVGGLSKLGNIGSMFSGVASKFLGSATSLLSKTGLSTVANFAKSATDSGGLLDVAKGLLSARKSTPAQPDPATTQIADSNVQQLVAYYQAQQLQNA